MWLIADFRFEQSSRRDTHPTHSIPSISVGIGKKKSLGNALLEQSIVACPRIQSVSNRVECDRIILRRLLNFAAELNYRCPCIGKHEVEHIFSVDMVITRKHSHPAPAVNITNIHNSTTAAIPTISFDINEKNNNNICNNNNSQKVTQPSGKHGVLKSLPDIFTEIDLNSRNGINGHYLKDDLYKPYIIGKFLTNQIALMWYTHSFGVRKSYR